MRGLFHCKVSCSPLFKASLLLARSASRHRDQFAHGGKTIKSMYHLKSLKEKTRLWLTFWPWGITYFMRNEKSCIQEIENQKEGVSGVNRLATKGEIYYWLPTKRDKLTTDYRHGPTLSIFVFRKRSILYRKSSKNPFENRRRAYLRGGRGGGLVNLAEKTMVSVLDEELGYKMKKKLKVMQPRIKNQFKLQVGE